MGAAARVLLRFARKPPVDVTEMCVELPSGMVLAILIRKLLFEVPSKLGGKAPLAGLTCC